MLGLLALLAGCASTAQVDHGAGGGGPGGMGPDGEGFSEPFGAAGEASNGGRPGGAAVAGGLPGAGSGSANSVTGVDGSTPGSTGDRQTVATGALSPVKVGVYVIEGWEAFASSFGRSDFAIGDGRRQAGAIIADLNKRGGLAGRRIEPVFAVRNQQSDESFAVQDQRACSLWTEDNHVVAAVSAINTTDVMPRCLSARRLPFVAANIVGWTAESFAAAPYFIAPMTLNQTRMAPVYVDRLAAQGFFREEVGPAGPIYGLVRFDTPQFARVARESLLPALARHGVRVSEEAAFSKPDSTSDNGATLAEMQSAVLRFKAAGVTHVLVLDETGFIGIGFLTAAEGSNYRPRYGLTTYSAPGALELLSPHEQLRNASGIDWAGGLGPPQQQPPDSPQTARCRKIVRDAGEDASDGSTAWGVAVSYCETLFLLDAVADRQATVQGPAWLAGLEAMGTAYRPLLTFATRFGPRRHDGAALVRDFRWNTGCSCFGYTSKPLPAG